MRKAPASSGRSLSMVLASTCLTNAVDTVPITNSRLPTREGFQWIAKSVEALFALRRGQSVAEAPETATDQRRHGATWLAALPRNVEAARPRAAIENRGQARQRSRVSATNRRRVYLARPEAEKQRCFQQFLE
jgi:hypothetical protein